MPLNTIGMLIITSCMFPKEHATQLLNVREVIKNDAFLLKVETNLGLVCLYVRHGGITVRLDKTR